MAGFAADAATPYAARMGLLYPVRRSPLSEYVDFLWMAEGYVQPHAQERVLPTGTTELVIDLDPRARVAGTVSGARSECIVLETARPLSLIAAHFKPGGAFPFFALPAAEIRDLQLPFDELWGRDALHLRDCILEAGTSNARFGLLERFLLSRLDRNRQRHPAVGYAVAQLQNASDAPSVAQIVERTGLSARRFINVFRDEVGLTPKVFSRLVRFRNVIRSIQTQTDVDWADTALACGYFDQPHFVHDFRAFAGVSPSAYLRNRTGSPNHVRIAA